MRFPTPTEWSAEIRKPTLAEARLLNWALNDAERNRRSYADFFCTKARRDVIARMSRAGWVDGIGRAARVTDAGRAAVGRA